METFPLKRLNFYISFSLSFDQLIDILHEKKQVIKNDCLEQHSENYNTTWQKKQTPKIITKMHITNEYHNHKLDYTNIQVLKININDLTDCPIEHSLC